MLKVRIERKVNNYMFRAEVLVEPPAATETVTMVEPNGQIKTVHTTTFSSANLGAGEEEKDTLYNYCEAMLGTIIYRTCSRNHKIGAPNVLEPYVRS